MSDTANSEIWFSEKTGSKRFMAAMLAGLVIEVAVIGSVITFTHQQPPPTDHPTVVKLSVIAPAPPTPPAPKPPPPKPVTPPPPQPVAPPVPVPPPPPRPAEHHIVRHVPPPPKPVVQPVEQTPPPTPVPPAPPPAAPSAGELDLFQARMRRAVQQAAITPAAAEMAHETGIVRVEFTYLDGVASNIQIVGSSGFAMLDDAARQAVRNANYPPQPPDMSGHPDDVVVDVIFRAAAADIDGD